ncbi:MAG: hypothetical protein KZQ60_18745, partial [Candidatus Thiodiazotropha sp. (ex Lucinoma aequizonata)]|nr:hypothetical protein [Candidatus Thiodiazotropha sp. (ex Lucinoma aequizonata)]
RRLGCALCMPFISPFRSPFRPYNRTYTYRGVTAFAPLSMAVSVGRSGFSRRRYSITNTGATEFTQFCRKIMAAISCHHIRYAQ